MPDVGVAPKGMVQNKPAHGAPCNRCGLCCTVLLCDVAVSIFGRRQGPCPLLRFDADGSICGLVETSTGKLREQAKLLVNAGQGCDMLLHGEQRDHAYTARMDALDRDNMSRLRKARRAFGL